MAQNRDRFAAYAHWRREFASLAAAKRKQLERNDADARHRGQMPSEVAQQLLLEWQEALALLPAAAS